MKKLNNKGFTLVELIVTFAIMIVLMLIAYPAIEGLQKNSQNKVYEEYGKSMIESAKYYVTRNERDLFSDTNCVNIQLSFLLDEDTIKLFDYKDNTCSIAFVQVKKTGNKIEYDYAFTCNKGGKETFKNEIKTPGSSCKNIA